MRSRLRKPFFKHNLDFDNSLSVNIIQRFKTRTIAHQNNVLLEGRLPLVDMWLYESKLFIDKIIALEFYNKMKSKHLTLTSYFRLPTTSAVFDFLLSIYLLTFTIAFLIPSILSWFFYSVLTIFSQIVLFN
jgi:hypothetical protein